MKLPQEEGVPPLPATESRSVKSEELKSAAATEGKGSTQPAGSFIIILFSLAIAKNYTLIVMISKVISWNSL